MNFDKTLQLRGSQYPQVEIRPAAKAVVPLQFSRNKPVQSIGIHNYCPSKTIGHGIVRVGLPYNVGLTVAFLDFVVSHL
jgi:hypothetical protein